MTVLLFIVTALAGGLGAALRFFLDGLLKARTRATFPYGTALVNLTGLTREGLREALRALPRELMLVETDAPYLTPVPHRGGVNASYLIPLTVRAMANVRGEPLEQMCADLWDNAMRAFGEW